MDDKNNIEQLTKMERLLLFLWVIERFENANHKQKFKNIKELFNFLVSGELK